jgi:hypothetical protein
VKRYNTKTKRGAFEAKAKDARARTRRFPEPSVDVVNVILLFVAVKKRRILPRDASTGSRRESEATHGYDPPARSDLP